MLCTQPGQQDRQATSGILLYKRMPERYDVYITFCIKMRGEMRMDRMKKIKKLMVVSVFLCFMALGTAVVQAKPTISKTQKMVIYPLFNEKSKQLSYYVYNYMYGNIFIKGVQADASVSVLSCSDKNMDFEISPGFLDKEIAMEEDPEELEEEKREFDHICRINITSDKVKPKLNLSSGITVKIRVTQGGKNYDLKAKVKYLGYKPFRKIIINGKNVTKKFSPYYRTITMKLAGKKLKWKKGYKKDKVYICHPKIGRSVAPAVPKSKKLKKGDMITIYQYSKKEVREFRVYVK